jgi:hypothetical protein
MLWAQPEVIKYSTINHQPVRGIPTRNQRARHLNFVNAKTTQTAHISVRNTLTFMAPSIAPGAVTKGTAMPRTAMTRDAMNDDRKLLLSALTVVGVAFMWPMLATRIRHSKVTAAAFSDVWHNTAIELNEPTVKRSKRAIA